MKKTILSSFVSIMALVALAAVPISAAAPQSAPIQGVWDSSVTLTDCNGNTLAAFRAFGMFHEGGTQTSVDNSPPTLHGPGFGTWQHVSGHEYTAPFQFFNFNADGSFAGIQKITRTIKLSADGNSYTSTVMFASYDPNGNEVFSGCGTESATRVQ